MKTLTSLIQKHFSKTSSNMIQKEKEYMFVKFIVQFGKLCILNIHRNPLFLKFQKRFGELGLFIIFFCF